MSETLYRNWIIRPTMLYVGGWDAYHQDYDGAPDAFDERHLFAAGTLEDAKAAIDELIADMEEG